MDTTSRRHKQLSDEQVRTLLDALLAAQREIEGGETTVNSAKPPKSVEVEGTSYSFADKSLATAVLTASGKPDIYMVQSAVRCLSLSEK